MAKRTVRIGILGYGVVGQGIVRLLSDNASTIESRLGAPLEVLRIVARDTTKARAVPPPEGTLSYDPEDVLGDPEIDIVVEVVGGIEPAGSFVRAAIERGKQVVTANKALLAEHSELIELAEERGVDLYFEAAVAGGIPIIRLLREAFSSDRIVALRGIVNGTSNYILSRMTQAGLDFGEALREAQDAGYAEADPTLDVGGGDAAHKLTILATLAFGARLSPAQVLTEGIDRVSAIDIASARRFGYVVKPLAVARMTDAKELDLRVHPALVPESSVLASISGALNAIYVEGAMLGPLLISGLGAGALPTAMSVVSDIVDVGRNLLVGAQGRVPSRAIGAAHLVARAVQDPGEHQSRYYLRFSVRDRPGILARIAGVLGAFEVSIEKMVQEGVGGRADEPVSVVMLTHRCLERNMMQALRETRSLHDLAEPPRALRIEDV
jgi:homoserine dehydrogenase